MKTEARHYNAKAAFLDLVAQCRTDQMQRKGRKPKQANAANVAMLRDTAAELRRKAKTV